MLAHENPKTVLIMGGGEGATAREVLAHKSVTKVVMVDIDEEFVQLCKTHIKSWGETAFADPRLEVLYMDINEYLASCSEKFDIVIGDLIDVDDWDSPAAFLYGEDIQDFLSPEEFSNLNNDKPKKTQRYVVIDLHETYIHCAKHTPQLKKMDKSA